MMGSTLRMSQCEHGGSAGGGPLVHCCPRQGGGGGGTGGHKSRRQPLPAHCAGDARWLMGVKPEGAVLTVVSWGRRRGWQQAAGGGSTSCHSGAWPGPQGMGSGRRRGAAGEERGSLSSRSASEGTNPSGYPQGMLSKGGAHPKRCRLRTMHPREWGRLPGDHQQHLALLTAPIGGTCEYGSH